MLLRRQLANRERFGLPQILIDVTILAQHDARTGIQRVTRAILMALIADPPPGYRIEPVRAIAGEYLYARRFTSKCLGLSADDLTDDPVEAGRGDIFLGVDWAADFVPAMKPWFLAQRRHGTQDRLRCLRRAAAITAGVVSRKHTADCAGLDQHSC